MTHASLYNTYWRDLNERAFRELMKPAYRYTHMAKEEGTVVGNTLYRSTWDHSLVTAEQKIAAEEKITGWKHDRTRTKAQPSLAEYGIARAVKVPVPVEPLKEDKVSIPRTKNGTVYARELVLKEGVTVGDLFALIDVPYRISRKAKVSVAEPSRESRISLIVEPPVLRVEWTNE